MKYLLAFCFLLCLFCSCNKDVTLKVEGTIMDSVTKKPIESTDFILEVEKYEGMKMQLRPTNFTTVFSQCRYRCLYNICFRLLAAKHFINYLDVKR